jgi:hypothetical protein
LQTHSRGRKHRAHQQDGHHSALEDASQHEIILPRISFFTVIHITRQARKRETYRTVASECIFSASWLARFL